MSQKPPISVDRMNMLRKIDAMRTQGKTIKEACAALKVSGNFYFSWKRRLAMPETPAPHTNGTLAMPASSTGVPIAQHLAVVRERDELRATLFKILTGEIDVEAYAEKLIAAQLGVQPTTDPKDPTT